MLFGTAKRLQLNPKQLELYYDQTKVNVTKTYTYLGSTLGPHLDLNFSENLDKKYKKKSTKLRLLHNVSHELSTKAVTLTYNDIIDFSCNQTRLCNSYDTNYRTREKIYIFG